MPRKSIDELAAELVFLRRQRPAVRVRDPVEHDKYKDHMSKEWDLEQEMQRRIGHENANEAYRRVEQAMRLLSPD